MSPIVLIDVLRERTVEDGGNLPRAVICVDRRFHRAMTSLATTTTIIIIIISIAQLLMLVLTQFDQCLAKHLLDGLIGG